MKVGDVVYDHWAKLVGILLENDFSLDQQPWIGMEWDFLVLYTNGDLAGALKKDLEVISESR